MHTDSGDSFVFSCVFRYFVIKAADLGAIAQARYAAVGRPHVAARGNAQGKQ